MPATRQLRPAVAPWRLRVKPPNVRVRDSALEQFSCQGPAKSPRVARGRVPRARVPGGGAVVPIRKWWGIAALLTRTGARARGGEGGIRTPGTVTRTPHFECGAFNHSATSPWRRACQLALCKQGRPAKQGGRARSGQSRLGDQRPIAPRPRIAEVLMTRGRSGVVPAV